MLGWYMTSLTNMVNKKRLWTTKSHLKTMIKIEYRDQPITIFISNMYIANRYLEISYYSTNKRTKPRISWRWLQTRVQRELAWDPVLKLDHGDAGNVKSKEASCDSKMRHWFIRKSKYKQKAYENYYLFRKEQCNLRAQWHFPNASQTAYT